MWQLLLFAVLAAALFGLREFSSLETRRPVAPPGGRGPGTVVARAGDLEFAWLHFDPFERRVRASCRPGSLDDDLVPVRFFNWDRDGFKKKVRDVVMCPLPKDKANTETVVFDAGGNAPLAEFALGGANDYGGLPDPDATM